MDKVVKNIAIICNTSWVAYNFRQGLMKTLISKGYNVFVFGLDDGYKDKIIALGCIFEELKYKSNQRSITDRRINQNLSEKSD
jgi:hypothetical protein